MLWRKQKYAQYKTFKQLLLNSAKATQHGCYRPKIVVKQIFNLDHRLYTLQKYIVWESQVEIGHTFMDISLSLADFTDFF